MKRQSERRQFVALLCVLLILIYAFVVFRPHTNECIDTNCTLCNLIETLRGVLIALLYTFFYHCFSVGGTIFDIGSRCSLINITTPVGLKVKLSN